MKRKIKIIIATIMILLVLQNTVYAATEYISTDQPNTTVIDDEYLRADSQYPDPTDELTSITVKYYCYPDDRLYIIHYDINGNEISQQQVPVATSGIYTYSPPSGTFATKLKMVTGSSTGTRYFWYSKATNNKGLTVTFDDPIKNYGIIDTGTEPPSEEPPSEGNSCDICVELGEIKSILNTLLSDIYDEITYIKSELQQVNSNLDNIYYSVDNNFQMVLYELYYANSTLTSIKSDTDDIRETTHDIRDTVEDIYDYLSTPRDADIYITSVNIPNVNKPSIPERERNTGEEDTLSLSMPGDVMSPGPLPTIPEPVIMEHEEPREIQEPMQPQEPIQQQQPIQQQEPLQPQDPIQRQEPLEQQYIQPQPPISPQTPKYPQTPITPQTPLSPQDPLQPQPPLQPNPPLR